MDYRDTVELINEHITKYEIKKKMAQYDIQHMTIGCYTVALKRLRKEILSKAKKEVLT